MRKQIMLLDKSSLQRLNKQERKFLNYRYDFSDIIRGFDKSTKDVAFLTFTKTIIFVVVLPSKI